MGYYWKNADRQFLVAKGLANFRQKPHTVTTVLTRVYLSLGSNLGDREAHLQRAIGQLAGLGSITKGSSCYETEPVEFTAQPEFLNYVVEMETALTPQQLLAGILAIECDMGRNRAEQLPKGPRTIDIDILLFGDTVVHSPELTVPHPAMHERRFVLEPLAEIAPDVRHPLLHCTVRELWKRLPAGQVVRRLSK
jgi:2-amino-4-hydroxy-6-hydroxymethyldihydropteridine diphosphokinase